MSAATIQIKTLLAIITIIVAISCWKIKAVSAEIGDNQDPEAMVKEIRKKCIASNNLPDEQMKLIMDHDLFTPTTTAANTPKSLQCYCLCYLNEAQIFQNNKPNEKFLRDTLPLMINDKKKSQAILDKCMKLEGADNCEIGFNFELCLIKESGLYMY
ncbi:uncharacterized protein [Musca autumnalis]|uniref:uncharacterized protein n=1 Tax=Musca autumnalis TaxID=221902 RepID=UPI003CEA055E